MPDSRRYPVFLILLASAYMTLLGNTQFFSKAAAAFPVADNLLFQGSLVLVIWLSIALLSLLFNTRYTLKPWLVLLVCITAMSSYFSNEFGVVIDDTMLINAVETNASEAADLVTWKLVIWILLGAVLPGYLIVRWPLAYRTGLKNVRDNLILASVSIVTILACILSFGDSYASLGREYKFIRSYNNPTYPIYSTIKLVKSRYTVSKPVVIRTIMPDVHINAADQHRELMILVVGETARADHFSLYGYNRKTNPLLEAQTGLHVFQNVSSCGTSTAVSVPCMFSQHGREDFDLNTAKQEENLLDVLSRVGVSVLWRDNNSSSKGVADRIRYEDYKAPGVNPVCDPECRDIGMLDGLQAYIEQQKGDVLIVLHMMGSHGPAYFKRVPDKFAGFQPACQSIKLSDCSQEEIINAYDNTILYTDYFLSEVIRLLQNNSDKFETGMLYISDHGESLGEGGVYLHGLPYFVAPDAQTKIPALLWYGDHNDIDEVQLVDTLEHAQSHEMLFNAVLGYFEIQAASGVEVNSKIHYMEK